MNLTSEQVQALRAGEPIAVVPPEVGEECVILRKDVYQRVQQALDDLPSPRSIARLMQAAAGDEDLDSYQRYKR